MSPNPIVNILGGGMPAQTTNPIASLFGMMRTGGNPMAMLKMMAANDQRMKTIFDVIQQNGGDPQKAFYAEADKRGANPDEILQQAQSMMN